MISRNPFAIKLCLVQLLICISIYVSMPSVLTQKVTDEKESYYCFDSKEDCSASTVWDGLTCGQSCMCQNRFRGDCRYKANKCGSKRPWVCQCVGVWFGGLVHAFCSKGKVTDEIF